MTRNRSFGADVGRRKDGRFVKLDRPEPAPVERPPLHVRLAQAKAEQEAAPPARRSIWRRLFG